MASVWKAVDDDTLRHVAVKIPDPRDLRDPAARTRFEGEVRALRALDHPHVVRVLDAGETEGFSWFVMELCEGGSLGAWVDQHGPMPGRLAVGMVAAAAAGLHEAHQLGIVHRDIKPANLLLTSDGRLEVADFGIARFQDVDAQVSVSGIGLGTLGYVAPEQREDGRLATPRSDVFALAATLYTLLTGRIELDLFANTFRAELFEPVAPALRPVLARALAFEPGERTATAAALSQELCDVMPLLPRDPPHPPLVVRVTSSVPAVTRTRRPSVAPPVGGIPRRRAALLVDEDPRTLRALRLTLEEEGLLVLTASTVREARAAADRHPGFLDLAVVDLLLAGDGAVAGIHEVRPGLPVLYTSSLSTASSFGAGLPTAGAIVKKPVLRDDLVAAVARLLGAEPS